uniref:PILR alpha associated neural protein n=1 Tax=Periophthalmus magnuspinnatus TaxID=409849 RepID=A0A3B3ZH12_9GOBI
SISPAARLLALRWLLSVLLISVSFPPSTCNRDDRESEEQLSVTAQATPTPLWAVVWGPTQPLEDETYHFISSQETEPLSHPGRHLVGGSTTAQDWPRGSPGSAHPPGDTLLLPRPKDGAEDEGTEAEETEPEEDPQFYVTVTISSLLILTAVVITAKL